MNISKAIKDLENLEIKDKKRIWKPFMEKYDCQIICELGVFEGENFNLMIEHKPQIAIAIDSWLSDDIPSRNDLNFSQEELDKQYADFASSMTDKPFVKIYREHTEKAVKHFQDEYFDLIYIDADHSFEGCLKDIKDWYPKVKEQGFLIGDDYREALASRTGIRFGVIEAVNKFAKENNLIVYEIPGYGWVIVK